MSCLWLFSKILSTLCTNINYEDHFFLCSFFCLFYQCYLEVSRGFSQGWRDCDSAEFRAIQSSEDQNICLYLCYIIIYSQLLLCNMDSQHAQHSQSGIEGYRICNLCSSLAPSISITCWLQFGVPQMAYVSAITKYLHCVYVLLAFHVVYIERFIICYSFMIPVG